MFDSGNAAPKLHAEVPKLAQRRRAASPTANGSPVSAVLGENFEALE